MTRSSCRRTAHKSGTHRTLAKPFRDLFWVESVRVPDGQERNRLVGDHSVDRLVTDLEKFFQLTNGQGMGDALDSVSKLAALFPKCVLSFRFVMPYIPVRTAKYRIQSKNDTGY